MYMPFFARFRAIEEKDKSALVRKLMVSSTPDFDFFYFVGLSVLMATLGLLVNSPSIVIGSMLIAPLLYPILGVALGLVMSDMTVLGRSLVTLFKSTVVSLVIAALATVLFGHAVATPEILARTQPSLAYLVVAIVAGAAVSYSLARPDWSETLPGVAISVALIPPLSVVGIGLAMFDMQVVVGSLVLFAMNLVGIVFAAMISFSLMNLHEKQAIAQSTIKKEDERQQKENEAIAAVIETEVQAAPASTTPAAPVPEKAEDNQHSL